MYVANQKQSRSGHAKQGIVIQNKVATVATVCLLTEWSVYFLQFGKWQICIFTVCNRKTELLLALKHNLFGFKKMFLFLLSCVFFGGVVYLYFDFFIWLFFHLSTFMLLFHMLKGVFAHVTLRQGYFVWIFL